MNGEFYTARDEAHLHALEAHKKNEPLPVKLEGAAVFHCGPIVKKLDGDKWELVAAGPTTSSRMNTLEPEFIEKFKVRAIIGKGGMSAATKDAMQKKVEEYYRLVNELQQSYMRYQKELTTKEAELTQDILLKMQKILEEMGRAEGYTMIYDRSSGAVVWGPAHLDLTDRLIQKYNSKYKGGSSSNSSQKK